MNSDGEPTTFRITAVLFAGEAGLPAITDSTVHFQLLP
jgi:hypothetical protein